MSPTHRFSRRSVFGLTIGLTAAAIAHDGRSVQPSLAAAWEFSPDALTATFGLRDGLRFSDDPAVSA
jgi:peptide/nickel transport system substrate-binding protein